jgi:hypothetical protein
VITLTLPFRAIIGELSFRNHRNRSPRTFPGANPASFTEIQVWRKIIALVHQALRRAVESTKTAIVALLMIKHRPGDAPAPGIQAEQHFVAVGPGPFLLEDEFVLDYHGTPSPVITLVEKYPFLMASA